MYKLEVPGIRIDNNKYSLNSHIDSGRYGTVYKSTNAQGSQVAVKVLPKFRHDITKRLNLRVITHEVRALYRLQGCQNVIQLYDVFQDDRYVYVVEEYCKNGTLDSLMKAYRTKPFTEKQIARIMFRILNGIKECHSRNIYHGDVKPANILVKRFADIKLADFGHSEQVFSPIDGCYEKRGTPWFAAPEIFEGKYGYIADVWAAGIIMYTLMFKHHPYFKSEDNISCDSIHSILKEKDLDLDVYTGIFSNDTMDFTSRLLNVDPCKRISAADALQHPFIRKYYSSYSV